MNNKITSKKDSLLSAIPRRMNPEEFFTTMKKAPPYLKQKLPSRSTERMDLINQLFGEWFHINGKQYEVYERMFDIISQSYRLRDQSVQNRALNNTIKWFGQANDNNFIPSKCFIKPIDGMSFLGLSGMGKSTCVENILRKCFPFVIEREFDIQIVHIKINCSSFGSVKSLCYSFLNEVDRIIESQYADQYLNSNYTAEKLLPVIANVATRHHLGVLVIDEVHHLNNVKGHSKEQIINFFKNLNATIGVPIVYIGTPEAVPILMGNFQIARRTQGLGSIIWDRYHRDDNEWLRLLTEIWKYQVLDDPGLLTEELKTTYYDLTQGIVDPLIKLHVAAQKRALTLGLKKIESDLLQQVFKEDLSFIQPMIEALRSNDPTSIGAFNDISTRIIKLGERIEKHGHDSLGDVLSHFFKKDFSNSEVKIFADLLAKKFPELKHGELFVNAASALVDNKKSTKSPRLNKNGKIFDRGLLPKIFKSCDKSKLLIKLKEHGIIKPISDYV